MSHLARRRDGRHSARAAGDAGPTARHRRPCGTAPSGAAARRLLDGSDDGPPPLPQLLAAASAPATAAELQGEAAARAAFRAALHATPAAVRNPRTARARTATAIVTAKIIAALALTAGTAGGVALATHSSSVQLQEGPAGTDTAAVSGVPITTSTTGWSTPASDPTALTDSSAGSADDAADRGAELPPRSGAPSAGSTGPCATRCTTNTTGPVQSSEPPEQRTDPRTGNGNDPDEEKSTDKKEKNRDNGERSGNGTRSDGATDNGKNEEAGDRNGGSGNGQTGAGKSVGTKKTDAGTTSAS